MTLSGVFFIYTYAVAGAVKRLFISYNVVMDTAALISTLQESLFVIVVFFAFLAYAIIRGRQSIINLILGLYLALLIALTFPYFDAVLESVESARSQSMVMIAIFAIFTTLATILFTRLTGREYDEAAFDGFGKKFIYALAATVLVMAYSYHALPVTEFVDPGSPIQSLFAAEEWFFAWLIVPLIVLFIL